MLDKIFNKKNKIFYLFLLLLILLHSLSVIGIIYDFPKIWHKGWYFHHGGDEVSYFELAKSFVNLRPAKIEALLGYPLFLMPFICLTKAEIIEDIVKPVLIIQTFILFNLSIVLVALITMEVIDNRTISGLTAFLWTFYPWILYLLVGRAKGFYLGGIFLTHHLWLPALSDASSAFFLFLSIYLFLLSLRKKLTKYSIFTAVIIGFASLIRIFNGISILLFASIYLYRGRLKDAIRFGLITLVFLIPQALYNFIFWKKIFTLWVPWGEWRTWLSGRYLNSNIDIIYNYAPYCLFLIVIMFFGFMALCKRKIEKAIFIFYWAVSYSIFCGVSTYDPFTFLRYLIPSFPAFFMLLTSSLLLVKVNTLEISNNKK